MRSPRSRTPRRRILMLSLLLACALSGGCAGLVRDVAMIPLRAAEAVAVESARLPFDAAKAGTSALVDAVFRNK